MSFLGYCPYAKLQWKDNNKNRGFGAKKVKTFEDTQSICLI